MSQHDYVIENATGAAFRADLNTALAAVVSQNSGATEPVTTYAYMPWMDTATGKLKIRNAANSAWGLFSDLGNAEAATLTNKVLLAATNTIEARSGPDSSAFSHRNKIINGDFRINQAGYVSGAATGADAYGHDMWKMGAAGDSYTFATVNNKTIVTIPAGKVFRQVIEGLNLQNGTYVLSWEGTAQGKIGAGALSASGVTGAITGGTNTTIEFGPGTVANIQLEPGTVATPFENIDIGEALRSCQRYYEKTGFILLATTLGTGYWKVTKRDTPSITLSPQAGTGGTVIPSATGYGETSGFYQNTAHSGGANALVTGSARL